MRENLMPAREIVMGLAVGLMIERPARKQRFADIITGLETTGHQIADRIRRASPGKVNVRQVRHVVGIERWSQRRLRVALGERPTLDEYDGYQPPEDADWDTLLAEWEATRRETVALARTLAEKSTDDVRIRHNQMGPLSVRGWLIYLSRHATRETFFIR
jgi:hypothetical protein